MLTTYARIYGSVLAFFLTVSAARAGAEDYRFDLVSTDHRFGSGAIVEVRWTDLRTGAAVEGAVIFATRMDMAPEGMAMMTSPVTAMAADVPGNYRFATDLTMAGGWRHPDGVPEWSDRETVTADGRAFLPVRASEDISLDPAAEPAPPDGGERGILYYRNPMGLPDTSPVPKQDSMGMDYIAVYTGEGSDDGSITVSPGKLQRTGVRTSEAVLAPLAASLRAPGRVVLDERKVSVISLRADAFIETVADVTTGSTIAEGAPLVTLYAPEIAQALALFVADVRTGARQGDGARQRLENLGVPGEVIDRIAAEGLASVSIPIMAPRSGVVLERMAVEGMMPEAGETLFRIADISTVWVIAEVPEAALMEITTGTEARISFRGLGGAAMTGRIETIYPELDMTTRTGKLRIELPNPDGRLRANMFAEVEIMLGQTPVVQVPEGAVIDTGDRQVVILDLGEGRFQPTPVVVGRRGGGRVEIVSGVAAGDVVVSTATFLIDAESNLNAALAALAAPEPAPETNP